MCLVGQHVKDFSMFTVHRSVAFEPNVPKEKFVPLRTDTCLYDQSVSTHQGEASESNRRVTMVKLHAKNPECAAIAAGFS